MQLRECQPSDKAIVSRFRCAPYGNKPAKAAQKILRAAADNLSEFGVRRLLVLAHIDDELVGAILFGLEREDSPAITVWAMGVKLSRHRQGIGTVLKQMVMAEAATRDDWPNAVGSQVHRRNIAMIGLNDKLGVSREPDPDDGEFLMTLVAVEPDSDDVG